MTADRRRRGRGATLDPHNRYHATQVHPEDDGWPGDLEPAPPLRTTLAVDASRTVITYNESPDIPFDRSLNPYRGCEHGCVYCYARPSHAWLDLSPGLDFEQRLFCKPDAADQLLEALRHPDYRPAPLALGTNTDAYQPIERTQGLTRQVLEVLADTRHPVILITKSALVERDIELLADMATQGLASVAISLTTLNTRTARRLEPRAAAPHRRLATVRRLAAAGVPVHINLAPVIPVLTDHEIEALLHAGREAGATSASYILLRLPLEVAPMFEDWLRQHHPDMADHVLGRIRDCRGGRLYDADFATRRQGQGTFADLLAQRFRVAHRKLGFAEPTTLRTDLFRPPGQMSLF